MFQDFEAGEEKTFLLSSEPVVLKKQSIFRLRTVAICAGLLTLSFFAFSVYQKSGISFSSNLSSLENESFKGCVDYDHAGSHSLEVEAQDGCIYLLSSADDDKIGKSSMARICSCRASVPILLSHSALEDYGVVVNGKSRLQTIVTGNDITASLYEGSSFEGESFEVGSGTQKRLNRYADSKGKSWNSRTMSISLRSKSDVCASLSKCVQNDATDYNKDTKNVKENLEKEESKKDKEDSSKEKENLSDNKGPEIAKDKHESLTALSAKHMQKLASKQFNLQADTVGIPPLDYVPTADVAALQTCSSNMRVGDFLDDAFLQNYGDTEEGCVLLIGAKPQNVNDNQAVFPYFRACSCHVAGVIEMSMGDLKAQNLVDADGNSLIAWIVTGKDAAISLYQDPDFADKNMLTIGPLRKVQLSTMPRISPDGTSSGTWDDVALSVALNSWSDCETHACVGPLKPTAEPTYAPTFEPTFHPTLMPTVQRGFPTPEPTPIPTAPTFRPTVPPTFEPTHRPSAEPSFEPTLIPTPNPTMVAGVPTPLPSFAPTHPTLEPTEEPTLRPTFAPTLKPTHVPSLLPTIGAGFPTPNPTIAPTHPTYAPTLTPTTEPTPVPSPATAAEIAAVSAQAYANAIAGGAAPEAAAGAAAAAVVALKAGMPPELIEVAAETASAAITNGATPEQAAKMAERAQGMPTFEPTTLNAHEHIIPGEHRHHPAVQPTIEPTTTPAPTYKPGFSACAQSLVIGASLLIDVEVGCTYFLNQVPRFAGQVIKMIKICSCSPLGILSFNSKAIESFGLLDDQGYSMISYVATGPLISISLYCDGSFQDKRQYTIGPSLQVDLSTIVRLEASSTGLIDVSQDPSMLTNPTWNRMVYSLVLNSWSRCIAGNPCPGPNVAPRGAHAANAGLDDDIPATIVDDNPFTGSPSMQGAVSPAPSKPLPPWTHKPTNPPIDFYQIVRTMQPVANPTPGPTNPTVEPTYEPTWEATFPPTSSPTKPQPSPKPTREPTPRPTVEPTVIPGSPTAVPTMAPSFGKDVKFCQNSFVANEKHLDMRSGLLPGCAAFLMEDKIDHKKIVMGEIIAPMTTICTCDLVGPIFLSSDDMNHYGLVGDDLAGLITVLATGYNVSVTLYDDFNFNENANKYVVGPSNQMVLGDLQVGAQPLRRKMTESKVKASKAVALKPSDPIKDTPGGIIMDIDGTETAPKISTKTSASKTSSSSSSSAATTSSKSKTSSSKTSTASASKSADKVKPKTVSETATKTVTSKAASKSADPSHISNEENGSSEISISKTITDTLKSIGDTLDTLKKLGGGTSKDVQKASSELLKKDTEKLEADRKKVENFDEATAADDDKTSNGAHDDVANAVKKEPLTNSDTDDGNTHDDNPYDDITTKAGNSWKQVVKSISVMAWLPCRPPDNEPVEKIPCYRQTTQKPIYEPTAIPTMHPISEPTLEPSPEPTFEPTLRPTPEPSKPTAEPTYSPIPEPTPHPTYGPVAHPTLKPTVEPSAEPTLLPTFAPSMVPTAFPTHKLRR